MAMKNFKQLMEDTATNKELAENIEEANKQARKTGDMAVFIKAAAELGYDVTEHDFPGDNLVKLDDEQLDDVAGGWFGFTGDAEDGNELGCFKDYYITVCRERCNNSPSGKHGFVFVCFEYLSDDIKYNRLKCKYCGLKAYKY